MSLPIILSILFAAAAVALIVWAISLRSRNSMLSVEVQRLGGDLSVANMALEGERAALVKEQQLVAEQRSIIDQQREAIAADRLASAETLAQARSQIAILSERIEAQTAMQQTQAAERTKLEEQFAHRFQNLANEILEDKSRRFTETNKSNIGEMLKPLGENIEKFRQRIEVESTARQLLEKEIERLYQMNNRLSSEANNLASALRGNNKMQGDWGEMILSTLLESSGLQRGIHFTLQESFRNEQGGNSRPDVVLNLPDNKRMVIDSKVSLKSYADYVGAEDKAASDTALAAHIQSVRSHINELGAKEYQKLADSLDFVIMFIPTEPALLVALQSDPKLWGDAYARKVILSSPTNLFAILKIVDDLWRRDSQDRNALEIARLGGALYDKFVGFAENFVAVGDALSKTEKLYNTSLGQLNQGKGNLVSRAERLRELGVKTSKKMPRALETFDSEDQEAAYALGEATTEDSETV